MTSVTNHDGKNPFADLGVRLGEPVNGQATTTAHVPTTASLKPGAAVRDLVDPKDPSYAEFPGQRFVAARWGQLWYRQRRRTQAAGS